MQIIKTYTLNKNIHLNQKLILKKGTIIKGRQTPDYIEIIDIIDGLITFSEYIDLCAHYGDLIFDNDLILYQ